MSTNLSGKELSLFKTAVAGLVRRPHQNLPVGINDLAQMNLVYALIGPEASIGFLPEAAAAISTLAALLQRQTKQYQRGAEFISFRKALADLSSRPQEQTTIIVKK